MKSIEISVLLNSIRDWDLGIVGEVKSFLISLKLFLCDYNSVDEIQDINFVSF